MESLQDLISEENTETKKKDKDAEVKSNVSGLELYSDDYPFRLSLRIKNFEDDSQYIKFIKTCERLVRASTEYKLWRNYIIEVLGVNTCAITKERIDECSIDVHHHVPSLFLLIKTLINEKIVLEEEFSSFDICLKAIELHFANKMGYIPLLSDMHKKEHDGYLKIPIELVKGDYRYFLENYMRYMDEEDVDSINNKLAVNLNNCSDYPYKWEKDKYPGVVSA